MSHRIDAGTKLYIVTDTDMIDESPKLHEILVKQGGEKRIKIQSHHALRYRCDFFIDAATGDLVPPVLSRTPEAAFRRYIIVRERDLELARGTLQRVTRQLEQVRDLILEHHPGMSGPLHEIKSVPVLDDPPVDEFEETIYRCKECGVDCASACSLHPHAGVNIYPPGSRAAGPEY